MKATKSSAAYTRAHDDVDVMDDLDDLDEVVDAVDHDDDDDDDDGGARRATTDGKTRRVTKNIRKRDVMGISNRMMRYLVRYDHDAP